MPSLSTLPKGDSAWLLRKSIERIMQQVSVLETNIGSSTTGNSSNGQVIFNDNGTLRGDADMTFNTALNRLIVSSLEVSTTATITGNLTVDTNTLFVDSSADKVGIGTTSLSNEKLTVAGNISANAWLGRSNIAVPTGDCSIFRSADNTLGFGIASTTAMTLNSTGLGVGVTPSAKLHVEGGGAQARFSIASASDARHEYYRNGIREGLIYWDANLVGLYATQAAGEVVIASSNTIRARVKASGQVRFVPLASDPAGAEAGDVYYNSTSNKLKCYNGTTWNDLF